MNHQEQFDLFEDQAESISLKWQALAIDSVAKEVPASHRFGDGVSLDPSEQIWHQEAAYLCSELNKTCRNKFEVMLRELKSIKPKTLVKDSEFQVYRA